MIGQDCASGTFVLSTGTASDASHQVPIYSLPPLDLQFFLGEKLLLLNRKEHPNLSLHTSTPLIPLPQFRHRRQPSIALSSAPSIDSDLGGTGAEIPQQHRRRYSNAPTPLGGPPELAECEDEAKDGTADRRVGRPSAPNSRETGLRESCTQHGRDLLQSPARTPAHRRAVSAEPYYLARGYSPERSPKRFDSPSASPSHPHGLSATCASRTTPAPAPGPGSTAGTQTGEAGDEPEKPYWVNPNLGNPAAHKDAVLPVLPLSAYSIYLKHFKRPPSIKMLNTTPHHLTSPNIT
ncbi:hypothetical protein PAPYR_7884 [Paratrimastix pyriformis]|uniref:Uncharacterized protein n=1 Tax=Paratrimastix pyriformis TaxID=342808 RepID=A0ABQ8UBU8_9EUKA|nr:hypothetical protein PAPYR_7884 [Paratrimastix pyriformis]